jgi:putative heme-binding domain-containing protein
MRRLSCLLPLLLSGLPASGQDHLVRGTEALSPGEELAGFTVAEGFKVDLFAAEPLLNKPINLAVDARGRVWVSSTVEYPYAAAKDRWSDPQGSRVRDSRDAIKIIEDTDHDGRADRVTDFADGLNIPTGVLPWHRPEHRDGCIAWSIPNVWYFADTDGDGRADHREVLFGPLGYEKDTHGMISSLRLGPDGWIYATHGFNNTSVVRARDGSTLEMHSGNVFRFRPDGSRVKIWSHGQVNPFGLAFDRRGNLYSADCHSAPVYQLLHGAFYPSFGKPHDGLGFAPAMIEHTHGSTGIAGIVYLDRGVWGPEWDDHVLIGNPVTSRVNCDRIHFTGTTPRAEEKPDFLTSSDPWFRPVDLTLGPDGALYLADFYNRIIGHYEVPLDHPGRDRERGRIWRIAPTKPTVAPQPPVETVEIAPVELPDALGLPDPWERRRAAAALVESPRLDAIIPLLNALAGTPETDTHLRHALRIALKHCLSLPRAYTLAFPEKDRGEIASISLAVPTAEAAAWLLEVDVSDDLPADFADLRRRHVIRHGGEAALLRIIQETVATLRDRPALDRAPVLLDLAESVEERDGLVREPHLLAALTELARGLLDQTSTTTVPAWRSEPEARGWEEQPRPRDDGKGEITVLSSLVRGTKGAEQSTGVLRSRPFAMPARLAFRLCGHRGPPGQSAHERNFVRLVDHETGAELARAHPPRKDPAVPVVWTLPDAAGREVRLEVVDGDNGSAFAWIAVGEFEGVDLPTAEYAAAAHRSKRLQRTARLLAATAPVDLRDRLRPYLPPPPPAPPLDLPPAERERLRRLVADRIADYDPTTADPGRGKALFATHCAACHRLDGEGGLVGPQLDGIGSRGLERLAEDILDPNRNVDAHFRLTRLVLRDSTVLGGFVAGESGEVLHLLDPAGQTHRIRIAEIQTRETTALSLMPPAFGEVLKPDDFRDLASWLLGRK